MRVNDNCLYAYPFFRTDSEDYIGSKFEFSGSLMYDSNMATLVGTVEINDSAIIDGIDNGLFAYEFINVLSYGLCSGTLPFGSRPSIPNSL